MSGNGRNGNGKNNRPLEDEAHGDVVEVQGQPEDVLRRLDHREWLVQAAIAFETQWKSNDTPITPFRTGLVTRLRLAAEYIALLERDARKRRIDLKLLKEDLENALNALKQPSNLKGTGA